MLDSGPRGMARVQLSHLVKPFYETLGFFFDLKILFQFSSQLLCNYLTPGKYLHQIGQELFRYPMGTTHW